MGNTAQHCRLGLFQDSDFANQPQEESCVFSEVEHLSFDFQVENSGRTVQYKLNAQSLRLFGLHSDVNDAHRAGENRLQNKTNTQNKKKSVRMFACECARARRRLGT